MKDSLRSEAHDVAERRAKDLVRDNELVPRRIVGTWTLEHVGGRGFRRPRFAKGARMYKRCGLPDPWDPNSPNVPLELGEVGIPDRRAPAPHAAPPKAATPPAAFSPRIPMPSKPEPKDPGQGPLIGSMRRDDTAELKRKMQEKEGFTGRPRGSASSDAHKIAQPVKALPVRPDIVGASPTAAQSAARYAPSASGPKMAVASEPARSPAAPRPVARAADTPASRPHASPSAEGRALPPKMPPPNARTAGPKSGGVRLGGATIRSQSMEPEEIAEAPVVPDSPTPVVQAPVVPSALAAAPPVNRSAKQGGLDDMFGMGAEASTRIRIPKAAEGEAKPRRPMVTEPPPGLDRRPPPPKPPVVIPTATATAQKDDLPEE